MNNFNMIKIHTQLSDLTQARFLAIFKPDNIRMEWKNQSFQCDECDCKFQLKSGDEPKILARIEEVDGGELGINNFLTYAVFCPEGCGRLVKIGQSFPTKEEYKQVAQAFSDL